jgi:hypothetical protein
MTSSVLQGGGGEGSKYFMNTPLESGHEYLNTQ